MMMKKNVEFSTSFEKLIQFSIFITDLNEIFKWKTHIENMPNEATFLHTKTQAMTDELHKIFKFQIQYSSTVQ